MTGSSNDQIFEKQPFSKLLTFSKIFSPIFLGLFYISIVLIAICFIMLIIVFLMNASVDNMLLPPFMERVTNNNDIISGYNIFLGNGVEISVSADQVTSADIKTVLYAGIFIFISILLVLTPIFKFLSIFLKNISTDLVFEMINYKMILYIGITVLVGNPFVMFINRFYNYYLLSTFIKSSQETISLSLSFDFYGIVFGLFILLLAFIYGYICTKKNNELIIKD